MKITLVEPSLYLEPGKLLQRRWLRAPSLTLSLLAALTPRDIDVSILRELRDDIDFEEETDLVAITSYTTHIRRAYEIADEFRQRKVPVVMGGVHVSEETEEALEHADTVIIGEAEETWPQFIKDFKNGRRKRTYETKKRPSLANLPTPRFSLLDAEESPYFAFKKRGLFRLFGPIFPVQTARGCPYSCDHCSVTRFFGGRYRYRPIADVVNEIESLGIKNCFFLDDNICGSLPRARELFEALIPLRIRWMGQATIALAERRDLLKLARSSGCVVLCIGLESLSRKNLDSIGKKMNVVEDYEKNLKVFREEGIAIMLSMMFGFDDDRLEVFKESYDFLVKNRVPFASWWPVTPFPGTALYARLKEARRLKDDRWWLNPHGKIHDLKLTGIGMKESDFGKTFLHYYKRYYSIANIVRRIALPPQKKPLGKLFLNLACRRGITEQTNILES
jgi:radical SAM superfamily enzyme YgiQ (UPF0313 family)